MQLEVNLDESKQCWDLFVKNSTHRSIFVDSRFLDSLRTPYRLITFYERDEVVAGAPIFMDVNGVPFRTGHPFSQYQGILLADDRSRNRQKQIKRSFDLCSAAVEILCATFDAVTLTQHWRFEDMRPFLWHNYHQAERGTFLTNLRYSAVLNLREFDTFDEYMMHVRTVRRQEFRKAAVKLEIADASASVIDELHSQTFSRQGQARGHEEANLVQSIVQNALDLGYGEACCAYSNGVPIAVVFFVFDDRTAFYLIAGNSPRARETHAGTLALMTMIRRSFERGLDEVDFVGVNSPNRGDYKLSYGPQLRPYYEARWLRPL